MLVRSWNVFHGDTVPPGRRAYLREMTALLTADRPDVLCLQGVPGWALGRVGAWSAMTEVPVWTKRPALGPLRVPAGLGRALTAPHHGLLRSAVAGQGNTISGSSATRGASFSPVTFTTPERSPAIAGFSGALSGSIDQVLVRGATAAARVWAASERSDAGRLLSDHAPVEARF